MAHQFTELEKGQIFAWKMQGKSAYLIRKMLAREVKPSVQAINKVFRRMQNPPQDNEDQNSNQNSKIFNDVEVEKIRQAALRRKDLSAKSIFSSPTLNPGRKASYPTICQLLKKLNFACKVIPKKHFISNDGIEDRFQWAKEMHLQPDDDFQEIIFTDESKIFALKQGRSLIHVLKGHSVPQKYLRLSKQFHGGLEIMVWGAIGFAGPLKLVRIEERMNSEQYIQILKEQLVDTGNLKEKIFQHDKAPIHTSKKVKSFLQEESVEELKQPGYSPDMNPIENVCAFVKDQLEKKNIQLKIKINNNKMSACVKWESGETGKTQK
ncbi:hypothetical protein ABPG72_014005 [Tetrahymena utriculariae]